MWAGGRDIEPLGGRLLLFFSDTRVPHEVMPAFVDRCAVTVWFYDGKEKAEAEATTAAQNELEAARVRKEMAEFEGKLGGVATALPPTVRDGDAGVV